MLRWDENEFCGIPGIEEWEKTMAWAWNII